MRRKLLNVIGTLQILSLINILPFYYSMARNLGVHFNEFALFDILQIILLLIITSSIILYYRQSRFALRLYYIEFFLRLLFYITTFGFILKLNIVFHNQAVYDSLKIAVVILEIFRLVMTIYIDAKWNNAKNGA
jgi:hypothetical protein